MGSRGMELPQEVEGAEDGMDVVEEAGEEAGASALEGAEDPDSRREYPLID